MDMGIQGFVEIILQAQLLGPAADVGIGRFGGFLHYIAQLSRKNQIALAFDGDRFCIQHFAAGELIPALDVVDWARARDARLLLVDASHRLSNHVAASAEAFAALLASL